MVSPPTVLYFEPVPGTAGDPVQALLELLERMGISLAPVADASHAERSAALVVNGRGLTATTFAVLRERQLPVVVALATAHLPGGTHSAPDGAADGGLDWQQLVEGAWPGLELASAGHQGGPGFPGALQRLDELALSRALLSDALGRDVSTFVYPSGWSSSRCWRDVRAAGFSCGLVPPAPQAVWDRWSIPMIAVQDAAGATLPRTGVAERRPARPGPLQLEGSFRRSMWSVCLPEQQVRRIGPVTVPAPRAARVLVSVDGSPVGLAGDDQVIDASRAPRSVLDGAVDYARREDPPVKPRIPAARRSSSSTPAPRVSVVLTTCNQGEDCARTIRTIQAGRRNDVEIVVVENRPDGSGTRRVLQEQGLLGEAVRLVDESRPGLSTARNTGVAASSGDIVVVTDDDVIADPAWLSELTDPFEDPSIACVTGGILPAEIETPAQQWLEEYGGYHKGFVARRFDLGAFRPDDVLYPYNAGQFGSGANLALRRDVLDSLGGFAEELGAGTPTGGGEDLDIFRRVITSGHVLAYQPAAVLWHAHRRDAQALDAGLFRYGVGLAATLFKWLLEPEVRQDILRRVPAGTAYLLDRGSAKNERKRGWYPQRLTRRELQGMALGPWRLYASRHRLRDSGGQGTPTPGSPVRARRVDGNVTVG